MSDTLIGAAFAVLGALCLAVQSLAVRLGTKTHRVTDVVAAMFGVNLLVLVPVAGVVAYPDYRLTPGAVAAFAVAGLLGSLIARFCYFTGIARLGASRAEPLKALFPVFAAGVAVVALGESLTLAAGVALLVLGSAVVAFDSRATAATASGSRLRAALAYPLAAALFLGIDPIFTKLGLATGTTPLVGLTVRVVAASLGYVAYVAWRRWRDGTAWRPRANRWLLAASVANTAYLGAYYAALGRAPVAVVTPLLGVSTLFVVAGAALFLQREERVTPRLGVAAVLVVAGAALVVRG
ncbi:drug/metabolite transporter (DMT)-like permease [Halarchaeum solikamskense]|uniref:EamA family transporter n=1 Tax=Halarchaeum nitratireducens TaxID=489913 RepID=UPI001B3ACBD1|nr:EamA family transporter [Halarchaeum solikamskense]MBP2251223.1 drug/metabolite transporter (DMT)-like permease [Halarchaeum solikamskense]